MRHSIAYKGVCIFPLAEAKVVDALKNVDAWLTRLGLNDFVAVTSAANSDSSEVACTLAHNLCEQWFPNFDTSRVSLTLALDTLVNEVDLEREILLCMLSSPIEFTFPSFQEFQAAVHVRRNIVQGARRTTLAFDTASAERPADYWQYCEGRGFTLLPGASLQIAIEKATQPEPGGLPFSFSCYRATEYVILLGIAKELAVCNPSLLTKIERHWGVAAVMSAKFHDAFLVEYGSENQPIPMKFYVPGDRVWFRNPDPMSSDIAGYEGSWVVYLGNGQFTDFWKSGNTFTLESKCIELYHWRSGAWQDAHGVWSMDEATVERRVQLSAEDETQKKEILEVMMRFRDPRGVYAQGGCIDTTRECPRLICPGTENIALPILE